MQIFFFRAAYSFQVDTSDHKPPTVRELRVNSLPSQKGKPPRVVEAQPPGIHVTNFGTEQGLGLSSLYCSYVDRSGNIWFGTYGGGVSRFDGYEFTTFNASHGLAHNAVTTVIQDRQGVFWFGTYGGGVSKYDGLCFTTFTTADGLPSNQILSMKEDRSGKIWIGSYESGICFYENGKFTIPDFSNRLPHPQVWCIEEDFNNTVWFGTEKGLAHYVDKAFFVDAAFADKSVHSICAARDGQLLVGTAADGLLTLSGESVSTRFRSEDVAGRFIWDIYEDEHASIWLGTEAGVTLIDGGITEHFSASEGLPHNSVRSIAEDNFGKLWFATYGGGVARYEGGSIRTFTKDQGLSHSNIRSITADHRGNLWFATLGGGINRYDGTRYLHIGVEQGLPAKPIRCVMEDENNILWIASHGAGLFRYDGTTLKRITTDHGLAHNNVRVIYEDRKGVLWFGTDGGVTSFDGSKLTTYKTEQGLVNDYVWSIAEDAGNNIWLGTYGGGISVLKESEFHNFTSKTGLSSNAILSLMSDDAGKIWIGTTGNGLMRFDGKTFHNVTANTDLSDATIYDVVSDESGMLWIGTNQGVAALEYIKDGQAISLGHFEADNQALARTIILPRQFNAVHGYPIKDLNTNAMFVSSDALPHQRSESGGYIWLGCGDDKLIRFDPKAVTVSRQQPQVVIEGLKIRYRQVSWSSIGNSPDSALRSQQEILIYRKQLSASERDTIASSYSGLSFDSLSSMYYIPIGLELRYHHNHVTINFKAIETANAALVNYQYRLVGLEDDWSPPTKKREAAFSNLREGTYTFEVRAQDAAGVWTSPTRYTFTILAPWYRTWWMYAVYVVTVAAAGGMFVSMRERSLRKENERLDEMIQKNTEELVRQKDELVRQKILLEQQGLEITAQLNKAEQDLTNQSLQMIQRFNAFQELEEEVRRIAVGEDKSRFQRLLIMISGFKTLDKEWEMFNRYFTSTHRDFYTNLQKAAPELSLHELRLCALMKMNLDNREIATLLNIEIGSVKVAKYRIKKKLNLHEDDDLGKVLQHY